MSQTSQTLIVIDGNNIMHRAYWAIPVMTTSTGKHTNALLGFLRIMFKLVNDYKPDYLTVAFDVFAPTLRHQEYEHYKEGRQSTPEDLLEQFGMLKHSLDLLGIRYLEKEGYEADDILGTLSAEGPGPNYLVSGDKDVLQLISDKTTVVFPRTTKAGSETVVVTPQALEEKYGLVPSQIPDLKGLMGDASDNIPGVKGVGEKTALKLLHEWGSVANIYEHINDLPKNKLREKLIAGEKDALYSRDLAIIDTHVDLGVSLEDIAFHGYNLEGGAQMAREYEFRSLAPMFEGGGSSSLAPKESEAPAAVQADFRILESLSDDNEPLAAYMQDDTFHIVVAGKSYDIPMGKEGSEERTNLSVALREALKNRNLIGFDIKQLMHALPIPQSNEPPFEFYNDVAVAAWVLDPSLGDYKLASVMRRAGLPVSASSLLTLWKDQEQHIRNKGLEEVYTNIEMPLLSVLYTMEKNGVHVDPKALEELGKDYDVRMKQLENRIYEIAGTSFNIGSPTQLSDVLFNKMKLPPGKKTKSGYSTDAAVLEKLRAHAPIAGLVLDYRALSKLKNTYVNGLTSTIHDGYIHTTFLQASTSTGRLASTDPNLQNIPIHSEEADRIRRAFTAPEGYTIVSADYSQIELRVLADIADDVNLRRAFDAGDDIHARTAAEILGKDINDVTKEERSHAKAVNFGIVYGISDYGLSQSTGLTRKQASTYIDNYLARFPGVREYMEQVKQEARTNGFVRTLYGRIRYIPDINSKNFNLRTAAERAALNMPIQGSAADIMKLAMISASKALSGLDAKVVLQVHDELIVYARDDDVERVTRILASSMEDVANLSVPLKVNTAAGKTWLEAK